MRKKINANLQPSIESICRPPRNKFMAWLPGFPIIGQEFLYKALDRSNAFLAEYFEKTNQPEEADVLEGALVGKAGIIILAVLFIEAASGYRWGKKTKPNHKSPGPCAGIVRPFRGQGRVFLFGEAKESAGP